MSGNTETDMWQLWCTAIAMCKDSDLWPESLTGSCAPAAHSRYFRHRRQGRLNHAFKNRRHSRRPSNARTTVTVLTAFISFCFLATALPFVPKILSTSI